MDIGGASPAKLISTAVLRIKFYDAEHVADLDHKKMDSHFQLTLG